NPVARRLVNRPKALRMPGAYTDPLTDSEVCAGLSAKSGHQGLVSAKGQPPNVFNRWRDNVLLLALRGHRLEVRPKACRERPGALSAPRPRSHDEADRSATSYRYPFRRHSVGHRGWNSIDRARA